jgi:signal transduction histidine kinase
MTARRKKRSIPLPQMADALDGLELSSIFEAMEDGVIVFDLNMRALYYNSAALTMQGWDMLGIDPRTVPLEERFEMYHLAQFHEDPLLAGIDMHDPVQVGKLNISREEELHRPDGTTIPIYFRMKPYHDPKTGAPLGTFVMMRDISSRRTMDEQRDRYLHMAAHELRAPMQPLLLASRTLQRYITQPHRTADIDRLAEDIVEIVGRMSRMVGDLMDVTRIDSGRFRVTLQPDDLARIVQSIAAEQRATTHRVIAVTGAEQPVLIAMDAERVWQALTNVVGNATKYSPAPAPVEIAMARFDEDHAPWVRISVRDYGFGIAAEDLPRMFDRYFQPDVPDEYQPQKLDGLGLGLAITQEIVRNHQGRIYAESTPGEGTTVHIELPALAEGH